MKKTLVIKLGGASIASTEQFSKMAELISLRLIEYPQIVIVVSAMGDTTDRLIKLAQEVNKTASTDLLFQFFMPLSDWLKKTNQANGDEPGWEPNSSRSHGSSFAFILVSLAFVILRNSY